MQTTTGVGEAVRASGLGRSFGAVQAVRDMTVSIPAGQITALVGPNGSGKTTLMLILATLLRPDRGQVSIAGIDAMASPLEARRHLGWMPDTLGVWDALTCHDILSTMGRLYGMGAAQASARADEQLEWVQLTDFAHRPARVLSRGQQQRISLARATVHSPDVLLLDEPANGLDPDSRIRLREDLRAMAENGTAILVSSHVLSELGEFSDTAVFVRDGVTVSTTDLRQSAAGEVRYRIAGPEPGRAGDIVRSLEARGHRALPADAKHDDAVVVTLAGREAAAALLAELVQDGVAVSHFAAEGSRLEDAYLALSQDAARPGQSEGGRA